MHKARALEIAPHAHLHPHAAARKTNDADRLKHDYTCIGRGKRKSGRDEVRASIK
mgnify:CR=1 FL=1